MIRRFLRHLGTALAIAGVALILDAGLTVVWQEPFSALYAKVVQGAVDDDLAAFASRGPADVERQALEALPERDQRLAFLARSVRRRVPAGDPVGQLSIPKLGLRQAVIDGSRDGDLRKGPGLIESTDLPGLGGTTAIAGHRTTYGAPFHNVDKLGKGDRIDVSTPYGRFIYRVSGTRIVEPTEVWVLDRIGRERLVLSACHPKHSAAQRIIVFAELDRYTPPAAGPWASVLAGRS